MFFEMYLRRLKDFTKTSQIHLKNDFTCLEDVTKKTSLLRCFWEVFEMSLLTEIWLRHLKDISCRLRWELTLKSKFYWCMCSFLIAFKLKINIINCLLTKIFTSWFIFWDERQMMSLGFPNNLQNLRSHYSKEHLGAPTSKNHLLRLNLRKENVQ